MSNLHAIPGFRRYEFDLETNRVLSKHTGKFLARNVSGKYQMIADNARRLYWNGGKEVSILTPLDVRLLVQPIKSTVSKTQVKPVIDKPWMVLTITETGVVCFLGWFETEALAKTNAANLAMNNQKNSYVVAERKHKVRAQKLVWE